MSTTVASRSELGAPRDANRRGVHMAFCDSGHTIKLRRTPEPYRKNEHVNQLTSPLIPPITVATHLRRSISAVPFMLGVVCTTAVLTPSDDSSSLLSTLLPLTPLPSPPVGKSFCFVLFNMASANGVAEVSGMEDGEFAGEGSG